MFNTLKKVQILPTNPRNVDARTSLSDPLYDKMALKM